MAFLEIKVELGRAVRVLERIADALDRLSPIPRTFDFKPSQAEDLSVFDPEAECQRQEREQVQEDQGVTAARRR